MIGIRRGYLDRFPRVNLGIWPTPLQELSRMGGRVSHHKLFIKRDDLTGLGQGGNKTRSLEFLLGDALRKGADVILTAGRSQSNLCSLTAAACCKAGIECVLVHNDDPPDSPEGNMILNRIFGAESVFVGKVDEEQRTGKMEAIARELETRGRKPYIIYNGTSTPWEHLDTSAPPWFLRPNPVPEPGCQACGHSRCHGRDRLVLYWEQPSWGIPSMCM